MAFFDESYPEKEVLPGARMRVLCGRSGRIMAVRYSFKAGTVLPRHSHPHEQVGFLVSGGGQFTLGGERRTVREGDGWQIPGGVEHGVTFTEDSVVVETFNPPREDFLI